MGEKRVYIATQSPMVNTVDDFWRMVWEQQTRTILMLNPMTSQGKVCAIE
jgi:receptor-type tyrosine-protein phosphatase R